MGRLNDYITGLWDRATLGKEEVAYRKKVKATYTKIPVPNELRNKNNKIVLTKELATLGKFYVTNKFPAWVLWDSKEPYTLYINIDMVCRLFGDVLGYKNHELDKLKVTVLTKLAQQVLKEVVLPKLVPKMHEKVTIKFYNKTDKYTSLTNSVKPSYWFTPKQLEYLANFKVGV